MNAWDARYVQLYIVWPRGMKIVKFFDVSRWLSLFSTKISINFRKGFRCALATIAQRRQYWWTYVFFTVVAIIIIVIVTIIDQTTSWFDIELERIKTSSTLTRSLSNHYFPSPPLPNMVTAFSISLSFSHSLPFVAEFAVNVYHLLVFLLSCRELFILAFSLLWNDDIR